MTKSSVISAIRYCQEFGPGAIDIGFEKRTWVYTLFKKGNDMKFSNRYNFTVKILTQTGIELANILAKLGVPQRVTII